MLIIISHTLETIFTFFREFSTHNFYYTSTLYFLELSAKQVFGVEDDTTLIFSPRFSWHLNLLFRFNTNRIMLPIQPDLVPIFAYSGEYDSHGLEFFVIIGPFDYDCLSWAVYQRWVQSVHGIFCAYGILVPAAAGKEGRGLVVKGEMERRRRSVMAVAVAFRVVRGACEEAIFFLEGFWLRSQSVQKSPHLGDHLNRGVCTD